MPPSPARPLTPDATAPQQAEASASCARASRSTCPRPGRAVASSSPTARVRTRGSRGCARATGGAARGGRRVLGADHERRDRHAPRPRRGRGRRPRDVRQGVLPDRARSRATPASTRGSTASRSTRAKDHAKRRAAGPVTALEDLRPRGARDRRPRPRPRSSALEHRETRLAVRAAIAGAAPEVPRGPRAARARGPPLRGDRGDPRHLAGHRRVAPLPRARRLKVRPRPIDAIGGTMTRSNADPGTPSDPAVSRWLDGEPPADEARRRRGAPRGRPGARRRGRAPARRDRRFRDDVRRGAADAPRATRVLASAVRGDVEPTRVRRALARALRRGRRRPPRRRRRRVRSDLVRPANAAAAGRASAASTIADLEDVAHGRRVAPSASTRRLPEGR